MDFGWRLHGVSVDSMDSMETHGGLSNTEAQSESAQKMIEDVVEKFELTADKERAFRIVANHAVSPGSEQLMMYVGGMGGTGKSQVIKALMEFYKSRNESHRFVVLAPTGTAAALCMAQPITHF